MDKQYISILLLFIFMVYLYSNNYKYNLMLKNYSKNNKENFTNNNLGIHNLITNVGNLSGEILNSIQTNTDMVFNNNVKLFANSNLVPLKSIIIWTQPTPPYPNTNPITRNGHQLSYNLSATDCWYPCIGGTIDVDGVNINVPNMKGRMIVGFGATNNDNNARHQFLDLTGSHVGGELPLRSHTHYARTGMSGGHTHGIPYHNNEGDNNNPKSFLGTSDRDHTGMTDRNGDLRNRIITVNNDSNSNHTHLRNEAGMDNTSHNYGTNSYSKNVIPHSTILQFWMRVR